jgi:acyl CoA:acetate/3-ketoacid CoA transferase
MQIPAESLSAARSVRDKVVTAAEAVRLIRDGDSVVVEGFVGQGFAEELTLALEERFVQTGTPRELTLVSTVAQGNRQGRGLDRLCHEGLLRRAVGAHWALAAELAQLGVAFLRGTTADPEGNITMEREALTLEALAVATAVHNAGGLVIVQVERVSESGSLSARDVKIPGILVDCVVVAQPEHHWQTFALPTPRRSVESCGGFAARSRRWS